MTEQKKIITCGSVDDGKSSLIGRIFFDTNNITKDQKNKLSKISKRYGTLGASLDLALLMDGLTDEMEQGITIDVAHKFLNFKNQRLVFCDSPGHHQYTRNVLTAASNCSIGLVLIDAKKGILSQTLRHINILDFVGIKNLIFVINKIDLIKTKKIFFDLKEKLTRITKKFQFTNIKYIPTSATRGDNVVFKSNKTNWYNGKPLLDVICKMELEKSKKEDTFFTIQYINRIDQNTRHYLGDLNNGQFKINDKVILHPSKIETTIKSIYYNFNQINKIKYVNSHCALALNSQLDITKGNVIVKNDKNFFTGDSFQAKIIATSDEKIFSGRQYLMRIHNKLVKANLIKIKHKFLLEENLVERAKFLNTNDIGLVEIFLNEKIIFSEFKKVKELSKFILIDPVSKKTIAAGRIEFALRKSGNIYEYKTDVKPDSRGELKNQKPLCIWFTGLSGSGKSTLAKSLEKRLYNLNKHTYVLDGDDLRKGINKDLGFSENDRIENVRRVAEISRLMVNAGLITIVSVISPFQREREFAKSLFKENEFFEIFVSTPLNICMSRDVKGLYNKSKKNKAFNKIGISDEYEKPTNPYLSIDTTDKSIESCIDLILKKIFAN